MTHDHDHPGPVAMQAALNLARGMLTDDGDAVREAAGNAACPACVAIAACSLGITMASEIAGDQAFVSKLTRARLLAGIAATEAELRAQN